MSFIRSLRCFITLNVLVIITSSASASGNEVRRKICMDDNWKFHFGHAADPSQDFGYRLANIYSKTGDVRETAVRIYGPMKAQICIS